MLLSKQDAKKKTCPFMCIITKQKDYFRCLADSCMSWRVGYIVKSSNGCETEYGYCGLAGKPVEETVETRRQYYE